MMPDSFVPQQPVQLTLPQQGMVPPELFTPRPPVAFGVPPPDQQVGFNPLPVEVTGSVGGGYGTFPGQPRFQIEDPIRAVYRMKIPF